VIPTLRGAISPGVSILCCAVVAGDGDALTDPDVPRLDLSGGSIRIIAAGSEIFRLAPSAASRAEN